MWAYRLDGSKLLDPRLVRTFADFEVDGLRTDVDGRIYLARLSAGKIAIIGADGSLQREVPVSGKQPTNLTFGGPDGRTVFVTQKEGRFIEAFRVDRPGREPCLQVQGCAEAGRSESKRSIILAAEVTAPGVLQIVLNTVLPAAT